MHPGDRNDIAQKWAAGECSIWKRSAGEWIVNQFGRAQEVARLERRGSQGEQSAVTPSFPEAFVVSHEKEFVLSVEELWNPHRAAQRESVLKGSFEGRKAVNAYWEVSSLSFRRNSNSVP